MIYYTPRMLLPRPKSSSSLLLPVVIMVEVDPDAIITD